MSTRAKIEGAADTLPPEQLRGWLRFLAERVEATSQQPIQTPAIGEGWPRAILVPESEWRELCHR